MAYPSDDKPENFTESQMKAADELKEQMKDDKDEE
jgi:hypothetical protein